MARRPRRRKQSKAWLLALLIAVASLIYGAWRLAEFQQQVPPRVSPTTGSIRIATWNLRKFSDRGQPDLVTIAKIIRESRFDLVAIQEVQQEGQAVQRLRRQLGEPWRHIISERTGNYERFAYLYRGDILELLSGPSFMTGPDISTFDRVPVFASFRAGSFDFTLVQVHLMYTDTARRRREAEALARFARDMAANAAEKDLIVLGDFNEQGRGNLHFFTDKGWRKLNAQPTNLGSTQVYDNILLDPLHTREWTGAAGVVLFDETHYQNDDKTASAEVSDHRPVWADFSTVGPDDD